MLGPTWNALSTYPGERTTRPSNSGALSTYPALICASTTSMSSKNWRGQGEQLARVLSFPEYIGMARAMLSWVAWKEGRLVDAEVAAEEALEQWGTCVVNYSWHWVGLWPLIAVRLANRQVAEAVEAGRQLLLAPQQRLPDELASTVQAAITAWEEEDLQRAKEKLGNAVELAQRLRYA